MEATPPEEVHIIAPENLPPEVRPAPLPKFNPAIFDRARKIEIVAELIQSGTSTSKMAAKVSTESHCLVTPPQVRGWMQAYNVAARELLKVRQAEHILGPAPEEGEKRGFYTPAERREILAQYHATGLGPEAAAEKINVPFTTLKKWIAAEKAREKHYAPRKSVAGPGANITQAQRDAALAKVIAGASIESVSRELLVSHKSIRNWYKKKFGKPLEARELKRNAMEKAKVKKKTTPKRVFTAKERILYAVRYRKLGIDNIEQGAQQLGVSATALRGWVKTFDNLKPANKTAAVIAEHGQISDEKRREAIAQVDAGVPASEVAKAFGVHRDSVINWYRKTGRKLPDQWQAKANALKAAFAKPQARPQNTISPRAADAIKRIENGELFSDVAEELGATASTLRHWWRVINGNKRWPKQYGIKNNRPHKKTRDRLNVKEAILSAQEIQDEDLRRNEVAPVSTAKGATHDAIVFLRLARDECTKAIKAGSMRLDDKIMLYTMLALDRLGK